MKATFPQNDAVLDRAIAWCPGLRLIRQPHWECLATFITSSLKQVPHIRRISLTLRERFGRPVASPGLPLQHAYPEPRALAAAGEAALRECGLGYRAPFLHRTAAAIADGLFDPAAVSRLADPEALEALCTLHGVGEKIASCALLFAWERHGAFPIDVWIERALRDLYFPRRKLVSARKIREFAQKHFGPYRGYAQQFLFHWARLTDCGRREVPPAVQGI
jgi:N-glycosylase/DNA lyase